MSKTNKTTSTTKATGKFRLTPYGVKAYKIEKQMQNTETGEITWRDHSYPGNIKQAAASAIHLCIDGFTFETFNELMGAVEDATIRIVHTIERYGGDVVFEAKNGDEVNE